MSQPYEFDGPDGKRYQVEQIHESIVVLRGQYNLGNYDPPKWMNLESIAGRPAWALIALIEEYERWRHLNNE